MKKIKKIKAYDLPRFNEQSFNWLSWINGTIFNLLGVQNRTVSIKNNRDILKKHAIGWCESDNIPCRPKKGYFAVMFLVDDKDFWTHFKKEEFEHCFLIK